MKIFNRYLMLLALAFTGVLASWAHDEVTVNSTATANEWTLEMPDADVELEVEYYTELKDDETIDYSAIGSTADIWLSRTLKTGSWNTFASPVAIDTDQLTALGITAVKQLGTSSFSEGVLTLNFTDAATIEAGKPYLVKVAENVENPTIAGVIVSKEAVPFTSTNVDFIPTLGATTITGDNSKEVLFLASENKLKNPTELPADIKGFRAYFQLKGEGAQVKAFQLNLGEDEATGIQTIDNGQLIMDNEVYDLQGRRVNKAAQKGVYIVNGKKTIIK